MYGHIHSVFPWAKNTAVGILPSYPEHRCWREAVVAAVPYPGGQERCAPSDAFAFLTAQFLEVKNDMNYS